MLTLVPTPIGNLGDLSFRTIEVLKDGDIVLCEDTRVTKKLLQLISSKLNITFPQFTFISVHSHNEKDFLESQNIELLTTKNCIYMSDAGMPCVSDPGSFLVDFCIKNSIQYDVLPGANALLTAYANSGFSDTKFSFYGFLPHKGDQRISQLESIMSDDKLAILYESPHRLLKLLEEIVQIDENRTLFLSKELTKLHQQKYKDSAIKLLEKFKVDVNIKGEWVVLIEPKVDIQQKSNITYKDIDELNIPPKQKAKLLSKITGESIKEIYSKLIG